LKKLKTGRDFFFLLTSPANGWPHHRDPTNFYL
jgi:hypothetical protein